MRFLSLIGTVLLAGSGALATPLGESAAVENPRGLPVEPRTMYPYSWTQSNYKWAMDLCGDSTFDKETDGASSPLVADCELVIEKLAQDTKQVVWASNWKEDYENLEEFAAICLKNDPRDENCATFGEGSCAFGFHPDSYVGPTARKVGYTDIIDVMRDAIRRAGDGTRVAASGAMDCVNDDAWRTPVGKMHWKIWNPNA